MRLRKNMKRAAAAALALSVALSAAAPAALAKEYDISKGDITVTVTEDGDTYVRVGDAKDENDIGEKDDTEVVIKGGENSDKTAENNSDGPADEDTADEAEGQKPVMDAEPGEPAEKTGTELIVWPENVNSGEAQKKDGLEPADAEPETPDTQKPEGKTDAATLEASTEQKPVEKAAEDDDDDKDDKDDKDVMTYEANTAGTVTKAVNKAVNNIIKIINNCTQKDTTVTIKDVNIDVSEKGQSAMFVQGKGDTTLKLEGNNTLKSGQSCAGLEKDDEHSTGKLTITAEDTSSSLNAYGGHGGAGIGGGNQRSTLNLEIANGKIHAVGGLLGAGIGGGGFGGNGEVSISGGEVTAQGGNFAAGIGGGAQGSGKVTIKNGKVTAKTNGAAAAIGGGIGGSGDVTILDGTVTATKNYDSYPVTGIGGASGSTKKSTVRILGGVVDAVGYGYGSGIGGGKGGVEVEIGGGAQVTAKGGLGNSGRGPGAAIGTNGEKGGKAGKEQDVNAIGEGTVTRVDPNLPADHTHEWTFVSSTLVAAGQLDKKEYKCPSCDSTRTVYKFALPAPVEEEQNGRIVLRVIDAPYEMHQESTRYIVTADSDTATLFGCLGNLAELKAQGVDTLVFRTESRETALDIDTMLSLGAEDTLFALTHSGSSATLTVGGADHSELIH
ncbi:MAG: hypothetical protein ACLR9R_10935 [Faecalibacterium prausnitzii]